jgi:hypothetical protein
MSPRGKVLVFVCIAVFAFTAIAAVPILALLDAQTPMDALFWTPAPAPAPSLDDVALPTSPVVDVQSPRAPPIA